MNRIREELLARAAKLSSIKITMRNLCDLELLATGGFSPLTAFMGKADYERVLREMRLADGTLWPLPITLTADPRELPTVGEELVLRNANNDVIAIMTLDECAAKERHFLGLVCEQSLYNLKDRMVELEVIPACQAYGLGIIPWSPLASGLLGGILEHSGDGRRADEEVHKDIQNHQAKLQKYEELCRALGERPADVALAWLLANPAVTAPIIGPRLLDQLDNSLRALDIQLDEESIKSLDEIWPGPGGTAPEAYAW